MSSECIHVMLEYLEKWVPNCENSRERSLKSKQKLWNFLLHDLLTLTSYMQKNGEQK